MLLHSTARAAGAAGAQPALPTRAAPRRAPARAPRSSSSDSGDERAGDAAPSGSDDEWVPRTRRPRRTRGAADPSCAICAEALGADEHVFCTACVSNEPERVLKVLLELEDSDEGERADESADEGDDGWAAAASGARAPAELTEEMVAGGLAAFKRGAPYVVVWEGLGLPDERLAHVKHHPIRGWKDDVDSDNAESDAHFGEIFRLGAEPAGAIARELAASYSSKGHDPARMAALHGAASALPGRSAEGNTTTNLGRTFVHSALHGAAALVPTFTRIKGRHSCKTFKLAEDRYVRPRRLPGRRARPTIDAAIDLSDDEYARFRDDRSALLVRRPRPAPPAPPAPFAEGPATGPWACAELMDLWRAAMAPAALRANAEAARRRK
jgi:hypothetical protein